MFRSILVPVDLATASGKRRALAMAADLAQRYGAELHVMTVIPDFGMSIVGSFFDEGFAQRAQREVEAQLETFCKEHLPEGLDCRRHVARGSVYDQILRLQQRLDCDCIVMGSHRPELKDYLLGPNAARVVRHAPCSVLVVRQNGTAAG
ncbi:MAG: universal stress protein [Pseudomonadota bacterium]